MGPITTYNAPFQARYRTARGEVPHGTRVLKHHIWFVLEVCACLLVAARAVTNHIFQSRIRSQIQKSGSVTEFVTELESVTESVTQLESVTEFVTETRFVTEFVTDLEIRDRFFLMVGITQFTAT